MSSNSRRLAVSVVLAGSLAASCGGGQSAQVEPGVDDATTEPASELATTAPTIEEGPTDTSTESEPTDPPPVEPPPTDAVPQDPTPADTAGPERDDDRVPGTVADSPETALDFSMVGACAALTDGEYSPLPCDQPHDAQFAGAADTSVEVLPSNADDARLVLVSVCGPLVAALVGRPIEDPGVAVGFQADAALGDPTERVDCFFQPGDDLLVGSILDIGFDAALGDSVVASDLLPGTCFRFLDGDNFWFVSPADCAEPEALVVVGGFDADGPAEWPGEDALRAQRGERCAEILASSDVAGDAATLSGTFPSRSSWEANGRRLITCDATPL